MVIMENNNTKNKYFIYARKSSENEDRQMASVESQINELQKMATEHNLKVVDIIQESKSAKKPDNRPKFTEMIQRIHNGEADGIICWKLNRLARNPVDGGSISWMIQSGVLQHIQTYGKSYYPNDNVIVMAVELGMANQFIKDLSVDTKRGLRNKAERGWFPGQAPLGYTHNPLKKKGEKEVIEDPKQIDIVRDMWGKVISGKYGPRDVHEYATKNLGLLGNKGNKIAISTVYAMLHNPFYYGEFEFPRGSGNWYEGKHNPIITKKDFDKVQAMLGNVCNTRPQKLDFDYRCPNIVCGECGCSITAENKIKRQKNGVTRHYIYYHCTKSKGKCSQGSIEEKKLKEEIDITLQRYDLPESITNWMLKIVKTEDKKEKHDRNGIIESLQRRYKDVLATIDGLTEMRANNEITFIEFKEKKDQYLEQKENINQQITEADHRVNRWIDEFEEKINFATLLRARFEDANPKDKKLIIRNLGSNLELKDKKLNVCLPEFRLALEDLVIKGNELISTLEPLNNQLTQGDYDEIYSSNLVMLRGQDSNL